MRRSSGCPPTYLLVLPAQSVGLSPEHTSFGGTLTIEDSTVADVWTDLGRSVARAGVRKLVIFNTHGGQKTLVDLVADAAALRPRHARGARHVLRIRHAARAVRRRRARARHPRRRGRDVVDACICGPISCGRRARDFKGLPQELAARNKLLGAEKPVGIGWRGEDLHPCRRMRQRRERPTAGAAHNICLTWPIASLASSAKSRLRR